MSEYLDKTGLSYLWGKIKGKLNNKADKSSLDAVTKELSSLSEDSILTISNEFKVYRYGKLRILEMTGYNVSNGGSIYTLPVGDRPKEPIQSIALCDKGAYKVGFLNVHSNGVVEGRRIDIDTATVVTDMGYTFVNISYLVA